MTIRDSWILFKEALRPMIYQNPFFNGSELTKEVVSSLKLKGVQRIFHGNPNTLVIITKEQIIRVPLDEFSLQRCQNNKHILNELKNTDIASFIPKFIEKGSINDSTYFIESKLPGRAIDLPISKMDYIVEKASDFITQFHKGTSKEIVIDDIAFNKLVSCDLVCLASFLNPEYVNKLHRIERKFKNQLLGKKLKTVWFHGDFKIENVLFDIKEWEITGVIDWDLSKHQGLPLLDIIYLLIYKESVMTRKHISSVMEKRYLRCRFNSFEEEVITKYLKIIGLDSSLTHTLMALFWMNHLSQRCRFGLMFNSKNKTDWLQNNVYNIFSLLLRK